MAYNPTYNWNENGTNDEMTDMLAQAIGNMVSRRQAPPAAPNQDALAQNRAIQSQNIANFRSRPRSGYRAMGEGGSGSGYHAMGEGYDNNRPRSGSFHAGGNGGNIKSQDEGGNLYERLVSILGSFQPTPGGQANSILQSLLEAMAKGTSQNA